MNDLMVQIGGAPVPLADCFWVRFNATDCACGSLRPVTGMDTFATAEQAHKEFQPRKRDRDRDTRQGYRVELLTRQQWKERAEPCFLGRCQHRTEVAS